MDLRTTAHVLVRQRRLVVVVLALTLLAAVLIGRTVSPAFESRATVLLLSPPSAFDSEGRAMSVNPFSRAGQAERLLTGAVIAVSATKPYHEEMEARGATGTYSYELTSEMMVAVRVTSPDVAMSLYTLETAIDLFEEEMRRLQSDAGAAADTLIRIDTITGLAEPDELVGSRIRVLAAVGVLGLVAATGAAFLAEAVTYRRARGAGSQPEAVDADGGTLAPSNGAPPHAGGPGEPAPSTTAGVLSTTNGHVERPQAVDRP
jgi:hypothetical protein